ncbi:MULTISPECIES: hypothetical protein [Aquimarina]|uniref:hypothetical protein n=1 Tax=Aquimarina TaxID=290174 RepID=UPI00094459C1|nr:MULTISPECIES: hypothetical protein [Aquimarina]
MKKTVIFPIVFFISYSISSQEFMKKAQSKEGLQNNNKYLIIEQAKFGKALTLSSDEILTISNKDDLIEIEITDYIHEWGYDAPPEDPNRNYFSDVQYALKVKVENVMKAENVVKNFWVSSSELESKGSFSIDLASYNVLILSDRFGHKSSLIEMIIDEKK